MSELTFSSLRLKKHAERRLRAGHVWIFSNEIDVGATPLSGFELGQPVQIQDYRERFIGTGYVNPHSLICARLVSRSQSHPLSTSLIIHRLKVALGLRARMYAAPFYRLVYAESDGLPGLVVDRYGDVLVVQITTAGMERLKQEIVAAVEKVIRPRAILLRNDSPVRELEGLTLYSELVMGELPDPVVVPEHGAEFTVELMGGQKTGWFFDQRENRLRMRQFVAGTRVLDAFSYVGAWGVQAALAGAAEVQCVDGSTRALALVEKNARANEVGDRVKTLRGDAFKVLKSLLEQRERFDVVILDPPAFIKRKKELKKGVQAYRRLNELALRLLTRDAVLVSCSCSYHLQQQDLVQLLQAASRHVDRSMQVLAFGQQGPDHPIHPAIPETAYLKAVFARVLI
jgi:23S rRNA (cytosine1962-C5)-methyltransferase